MNRRGFLHGILAAGMAPAIVKAEILMPVRKIIVPSPLLNGYIGSVYGISFIAMDHVLDAQAHTNGVWSSRIGTWSERIDDSPFIIVHPESDLYQQLRKGHA